MATRKSIFIIYSLILFLIGTIFSMPGIMFGYYLSNYNKIVFNSSYYYTPNNVSTIENIFLNSDLGEVKIKYVYPQSQNIEYCVKINVKIEIAGQTLGNRQFTDFFIINWDNESIPLNFTLLVKPNVSLTELFTVLKNCLITVYLRADIVFDISTSIKDGDVDVSIPYNVRVNSIKLNISNGNIKYNLIGCYIEGNLTGFNKEGDIELSGLNMKFSNSSSMKFSLKKGDLDLYINQYEMMGANVSCIAEIDNGKLGFYYDDSSGDIGARFEIPFGTHTSYDLPECIISLYIDCVLNGFHFDQPNLDLVHEYEDSFVFTSMDLYENRAINNYNMTFFLIQGIFDMSLESVG